MQGGNALPVWQRLLMDCMLSSQLQMSIVQVLLDHQQQLEEQAPNCAVLQIVVAQLRERMRMWEERMG